MSNVKMSEINTNIYFTETLENGDIIVEFYKLNECNEKQIICEVVVISDLNVMSIEPNSKYIKDSYDYLVLTRALQMSILNEISINPITVLDVENNGLIFTKDNSINIIREKMLEDNIKFEKYVCNKDSIYTYKNDYKTAVNQ